MADKFPALDSIDNEVPTNDSTEDVGESDFLSREKELLGDEFKTEDDKDALEGSDDEINDFKEQFPDVEDTKADEEEESETDDKGFEDDVNTGFSSNASESIEDSKPIKEWKERRDLEISERENANSKKKEGIISKAQETIDDFYENYNNKKEKHSKDILKEQEEFLEKRDGFLKNGTLWDRVNELVEEVGELPDDGNRDKTRFKKLLGKLKGKENAPGAGGY